MKKKISVDELWSSLLSWVLSPYMIERTIESDNKRRITISKQDLEIAMKGIGCLSEKAN